MASAAGAGGGAEDASVGDISPEGYATARADDAGRAVKSIEDKLAGMKQSLADAKAEAKRLRTEAGGQ